jgi:phosphoenolpyruvate-protein phosphotransferase (PTS system enzyme I)
LQKPVADVLAAYEPAELLAALALLQKI